jgi:hypothetical protein
MILLEYQNRILKDTLTERFKSTYVFPPPLFRAACVGDEGGRLDVLTQESESKEKTALDKKSRRRNGALIRLDGGRMRSRSPEVRSFLFSVGGRREREGMVHTRP